MANASIRQYVTQHKHLLAGRVLDFGCGKPGTCRVPQPYRDLVSGEYVGMDIDDPLPQGLYDTVLCTEVLMYMGHPDIALRQFREWCIKPGGHLLLTYTSAWPECEASSLWRFTAAGMRYLLESAGFEQVTDTPLCEVRIGGNTLVIGHGCEAVKL